MLQAVAAGKFEGLEDMITKEIHLEDVVEQGIKVLASDKSQGELLKHLLKIRTGLTSIANQSRSWSGPTGVRETCEATTNDSNNIASATVVFVPSIRVRY